MYKKVGTAIEKDVSAWQQRCLRGAMIGPMRFFACDECEAIYHQRQEAAVESRVNYASIRSTPPQDLADWLNQLDDEECARLREGSKLWKTWRRWRDHRTLTGHVV